VKSRFTQADLTRAVAAMRKAGCCVTGAKIEPDGSITILAEEREPDNDWRAGSPLYERAG